MAINAIHQAVNQFENAIENNTLDAVTLVPVDPQDPRVTPRGHTYDPATAQQVMAGNGLCPLTMLPMNGHNTNFMLRDVLIATQQGINNIRAAIRNNSIEARTSTLVIGILVTGIVTGAAYVMAPEIILKEAYEPNFLANVFYSAQPAIVSSIVKVWAGGSACVGSLISVGAISINGKKYV